MTRRLLGVCIGAALVCALTAPAIVAKPPDLPENGTITAVPRIPQPAVEDDVLSDVPPKELGWFSNGSQDMQAIMHAKYTDWFSWILAHWTARQQPLPPEQNEGYIQRLEPQHFLSGLTPAGTLTSDLNIPIVQVVVETLPMPHEDTTTQDGVTCPYLRRQMLDHHAVQLADPQIGQGVLDNLARLKEADELLDLAEVLANEGCLDEAMACCDRAEELCPGSPCAERAAETKLELALGIVRPTSGKEEAAETEGEEVDSWRAFWLDLFLKVGLPLKHGEESEDLKPSQADTGKEEMVCGLMRACHLLMGQGMHHEAAELARQAFALDPQRVQADPLIYKMHLLAASPPSKMSEECDPPTCPYCGNVGKPIREIVSEPKKNETETTTLLVPPLPKVDYELVPALDRVLTEETKPNAGTEEASESTPTPNYGEALMKMIQESPLELGTDADGSLRLSGDCSLGGNVYHLRYTHGCVAIWKTTDAGKP